MAGSPAPARGAAQRPPSIVFLNNQGLTSVGGGATILRYLATVLAPDHDVIILSHDQPAIAPPDRVRQTRMDPPALPSGPLWRIAPLLRAKHLACSTIAREALTNADLAIGLDCHFAELLRQARPRRLIHLSLSCTPRQEWFGASGVHARLRFLQYAWLERQMACLADRVVVASKAHAAEMARFDAMPRLQPLVLYPVLPGAISPTQSRSCGQGNVVTVLSAGRLEPGKNFGAVLDIAARLHDIPCRFVIVGDGPELVRLQARAATLGVDERVVFTGAVPSIDRLLAGADLFLHTSRYESFGIAPFEAMRMGVPPVVSAEGTMVGCREIMRNGVDALFIDFSQPETASQVLRKLILDGTMRERMGEAARVSAMAVLAAQDYGIQFRAVVNELLTS